MPNAIRLTYPYVNETRNTIKADHPIINWFESTGTLQLQGSQAATYKVILNRELLNTETDDESYDSCYSDDATAVSSEKTSLPQFDVVTHSDLHTEVVST